MASVELVGVEKRYGDVEVVRSLSLAVADGELLVLVGRSGCGKSTCLRMIAGLEEVTQGEVRIGGQVVNDRSPKDRDIAMVFQSYALYPHMTVRENLAFGLVLRRMPAAEIDARVTEVARMLDLGDLLERRPRALSGGQRQRVAMGRAIARHPQVFLFDEPLSNLDAALRVQMRAELGALHRRLGTTMVYVTHDQVEAMTLATRIAVLDGGRLQQVAAPLDLFHRPANRFVAGFIGSPSMNFLDGEVADDAGPVVAGTGGGLADGSTFHAAGIRIPLGARFPAGRTTLGIRPHDLVEGSRLRGEVVALEPMGWEAFAHVRTEAGTIVARLEGRRAAEARIGDRVGFDPVPDRIHLFGRDGAAMAPNAGANGVARTAEPPRQWKMEN